MGSSTSTTMVSALSSFSAAGARRPGFCSRDTAGFSALLARLLFLCRRCLGPWACCCVPSLRRSGTPMGKPPLQEPVRCIQLVVLWCWAKLFGICMGALGCAMLAAQMGTAQCHWRRSPLWCGVRRSAGFTGDVGVWHAPRRCRGSKRHLLFGFLSLLLPQTFHRRVWRNHVPTIPLISFEPNDFRYSVWELVAAILTLVHARPLNTIWPMQSLNFENLDLVTCIGARPNGRPRFHGKNYSFTDVVFQLTMIIGCCCFGFR